MDGKRVRSDTGMVIWGEAGNNAQHSFYQLLHQGTRDIPVDFILPVKSSGASQAQQDLAIANCLGQAEALMDGFDAAGLEQLIALYEHKVFVEGVIWGIDSFDQWGVELGKKIASSLAEVVAAGKAYRGGNASTRNLLNYVRRFRK